ncbi:hypothetical protein [Streptomyces sp. YIM S03343]
MTFVSLRKHDPKPEPDDVREDIETEETAEDGAGYDQEPAGHPVLGLLPALAQGVRGWCAWCSARIGVGPTLAVHGVALYAAGRYSLWVSYGVTGAFGLAVLLFTPREALERVSAYLDARDTAREARRAARGTDVEDPADEAPEEPPVDPLVALMWRLIGGAPGVHLKTLAEVLAEAAAGAGGQPPTKAEVGAAKAGVEAALTARGIPLRPSVRDTRDKVNRGVHRADLEAWEKGLSPTESVPPTAGP